MDKQSICPVCLSYFISSRRKYCTNSCKWKAHKPNPEKRKATLRRYYEKNKAKMLKANIKWLKANRDKANLAQQNYYKRHREEIIARVSTPEARAKINARRKEWKKSNPEKVCVMNAKQHNRIKFDGVRNSILERDEHICQDCLTRNVQISVHHIDHSGQTEKPNNSPENLVALCRSCHRKRHLNQK